MEKLPMEMAIEIASYGCSGSHGRSWQPTGNLFANA
jgi:hypothetical protein